MGHVKSAFEKALEKMEQIEPLTAEEKEALQNQERLKTLLASFYKGQLTRDELWQDLKGSPATLLRDAQRHMVDSLRLANEPEELQLRKNGILALETLKDKQNTSSIETVLKSIEMLQREYREAKKGAVDQLRAAVEQNPQLRLRPVRTPDGRTVLQPAVSVDEAVQARLSEFLTEHEKRYDDLFARAVDKLRKELR